MSGHVVQLLFEARCAAQPWRCLWRGFSQITMTRPFRRITLHLSQIFLTLGLTFIELSMWADRVRPWTRTHVNRGLTADVWL